MTPPCTPPWARPQTTGKCSGEGPRLPATCTGIEVAEDPSPSLFDRTIAHRRSIWATLGLVLLIYLPTLAAAYELGLTDVFTNPGSRGILSGPTIIAYIVVLGPILAGPDRILVRSPR